MPLHRTLWLLKASTGALHPPTKVLNACSWRGSTDPSLRFRWAVAVGFGVQEGWMKGCGMKWDIGIAATSRSCGEGKRSWDDGDVEAGCDHSIVTYPEERSMVSSQA